jgi:tetrahydromethanopterin S-methyltransferase subunit G
VTTADVERLYRMLESIDKRIQEIEEELAETRGREYARNMTKTQAATWAGIIIAGISVGTTILLKITETL